MVTVAVPGERWEVDLARGPADIERFISNGEIAEKKF